MLKLGECIVKRYAQLDADRGNWKDYWSQVAKYIHPNRDNVYGESTAGERKNNQVFEGTAIRANRDYANAMLSLLMNPSTKWMMYSTGIPELDLDDKVHKWLDVSTRITLNLLGSTNFYVAAHEAFLDDGCLGTSAVVALKDEEDYLRFETQPIFEWVIAENNKKEIDVAHRKYMWTLRQMVQEFGEDVVLGEDNELRRTYKEKPDTQYEIIQAIEPKENLAKQYPEVERIQNPFVSIHVLKIKNKVLKVGGFSSKPIVVSRHSRQSGELYGRSPGMEAFPEIMSANSLRKITLVGGQLAIAPPLQATDNSVLRGVKMSPYGMTYRRPGSEPIEPLFTGARPDIGQDLVDQIAGNIEKFYYLDQLRTVQNDRMTATEIMQRRDEQFRSLAALLIRKDQDFCKPIITRVFNILFEAGAFPEPPEAMKQTGGRIKIVYNSMIAKAMQMAEAENFTRAMQISAPAFELDQNSADNIDSDAVVRRNFKDLGVHAEFLRTEKKRDEIREARAQAQQAQMEAEQAKTQSEALRNESQADQMQQGQ